MVFQGPGLRFFPAPATWEPLTEVTRIEVAKHVLCNWVTIFPDMSYSLLQLKTILELFYWQLRRKASQQKTYIKKMGKGVWIGGYNMVWNKEEDSLPALSPGVT